MEEKRENRLVSFIKKYAAALLAGCVILLLAVYFINIILKLPTSKMGFAH